MPKKPIGPKAATTAERTRALRERRAAAGMREIRGIYAPLDLHSKIKTMINQWLERSTPG